MMMRRVLTTTVLLLGLSVAAHADILATGPLYANSSQNTADCLLFNAGTGPVTVTSNQIIRDDGISIALNFDNCNVLGPNHSCGIAAFIGNRAYSCKFVTSPSAADVRGDFRIQGPCTFGAILSREALR